MSTTEINKNPLKAALDQCSFAFKIVFWFAFCINLLMLITPLYSLQVLDRVLGSSNLNTLLMLSIIIATIYFAHTLLQIARSFTFIKIGEWLDKKLSPVIFSHSISASATSTHLSSTQMLRDFQTVKSFLTSVGINTLFDAPWSIVYIFVVFMIHPYLGYITIIGGALVVFFGFFNAVATNKVLGESSEFFNKGLRQADIANRNAETIEAMGMAKNVAHNWGHYNSSALSKQSIASYRNGVLSNFSRFVRSLVQMAITGVGAYIVVSTNGQEMTPGNMIASSIIVGKALAPFDNAIMTWKSISQALKAYKNLNKAFSVMNTREEAMPISDVKGFLEVKELSFSRFAGANINSPLFKHAPEKSILKNISFSVNPGEVLAVIGRSAAGKSTLSKLIIGIYKPTTGSVRLDSGEVFNWNRENFGHHVGYLPQSIELFSGTVKHNIARMAQEIDPDKVIEAAKMAGAHEMILHLKDGYDTDIGVGGSNLSGGQRQRLALARAFYGNPKMVILDEPNANLDTEGEKALANAMKESKKRNITVVVISHRKSILSEADKILVLEEGEVADFGSKADIASRMVQN